MRCRDIVNSNVVWFGSIGKDAEGNAIFAHNTHESYVDEQQGIAASLTQRLSVLKGELWYNISYGISITDKVKNKAQLDMDVLKIVNDHPDVVNVTNFVSSVVDKVYSCEMIINSIYGDIKLTV